MDNSGNYRGHKIVFGWLGGIRGRWLGTYTVLKIDPNDDPTYLFDGHTSDTFASITEATGAACTAACIEINKLVDEAKMESTDESQHP